MIVVSDTSPIINLAMVGYLRLLPELFGNIIIPEAVFQEITEDLSKPGALEIANSPWVLVRQATNQIFIDQLIDLEELDGGESEAIALSVELNAGLLLIDEKLGRAIALKYQVQTIGLLGVLLKAKEKGLISEIRPILISLIENASFYISESLFRQVILAAGE